MKKRKLGGLLVSLALILSLVLTSTVTASAATTKINKTKASINSGSTITLKISNTSKKVTWSSSNKSVATVKSTGSKTAKVTAKLAGKATITAKVGDKKFKCVVTVKKKVGTKYYPASAKSGVTYDTSYGTVYYKVKKTLVGDDAKAYLKEMWPDDWDLLYNGGMISFYTQAGRKMVAVEYEVSAPSGYTNWAIEGDEVIDFTEVYDKKCSKLLSQPAYAEGDVSGYVEEVLCDGTSECYSRKWLSYHMLKDYEDGYPDGKILKVAAIFFAPEDLTTFTTYNTTKSGSKYWVKYSLPK